MKKVDLTYNSSWQAVIICTAYFLRAEVSAPVAVVPFAVSAPILVPAVSAPVEPVPALVVLVVSTVVVVVVVVLSLVVLVLLPLLQATNEPAITKMPRIFFMLRLIFKGYYMAISY
jgi:hypothetical protein